MIDKKSGTVAKIDIELINGERISFGEDASPWYFEFKKGFLEVCSNTDVNSVSPERNFLPLVNIKRVRTKDFGEVM